MRCAFLARVHAPGALRSSTRALFIAILCACILVSGCAKKKVHAARVPRIGATEKGLASWYGIPYHGRRAANGETYDMEKMTAAHRTLPFGTWVEVNNLDNGKVTSVRITDRGPFVRGRIIDLSKAAAREIDMLGPGIAEVRLKIVAEPRDVPSMDFYGVQVGAFQDRARAQALASQLETQYGVVKLVLRPGQPSVWRVLVGSEPTIERASELRDRLQSAGQTAFVVRLDP